MYVKTCPAIKVLLFLPISDSHFYAPRERSSGGYIEISLSVCPSDCPSVCADSYPAHNFFWFDIGLPYLAYGCITMRRCVAYIHELFMTLTFDLNIKIIFSPQIWVWLNVSAFWHRHTKFWHMGVSPWDNMLCKFLTFVWPWP